MFNFEKLEVYQESLILSDEIYKMTKKFPQKEVFGLTSQLRRAAISIPVNIAEGSSRYKKEFRHFLVIARGSCYECVALIDIARRQGYITDVKSSILYDKLTLLSKRINSLRKTINYEPNI